MNRLGLLLIIAAAACKSSEAPPAAGIPAGSAGGDEAASSKPGKPATPGRPAADPVAAGDAVDPGSGRASMTGSRPHQGANCPASLPGTYTKLAMTPDGVDVSVTTSDPAVERQIIALAVFHAHGETAEVPRPHDGKHGGSGRMGYCPIIVNETTQITSSTIPGGVTLHIHARSASRVKELQDLVKQRALRLSGYLSS